MGKYNSLIKRIDQLSDREIQAITRLYLAYYDGSNQAQVHHDLSSKTEVILVFYECELIAFSSYQIYLYQWNNQPIRVIYSGDTIVEKAHWGQQALAFAWIERTGEIKAEYPDLPLYWFLIVKGHRTYKYLPVFGKSFFPHWEDKRVDLKPLADALAQDKFADCYDPEKGIIEFKVSKGHLKTSYAFPSENEKNKASVQFFLKKNPGYLNGNELVCLCEMNQENMKPLTKRIFSRGLLRNKS